ncbi:hypothetical protein MXB_3599, partial [Myxobolus squamalis]
LYTQGETHKTSIILHLRVLNNYFKDEVRVKNKINTSVSISIFESAKSVYDLSLRKLNRIGQENPLKYDKICNVQCFDHFKKKATGIVEKLRQERTSIHPAVVMINFEYSAYCVMTSVWPKICINKCYIHLRQAI